MVGMMAEEAGREEVRESPRPLVGMEKTVVGSEASMEMVFKLVKAEGEGRGKDPSRKPPLRMEES